MILLIDGGHVSIRCLFSSKETIGDFRLFRHIYFKTIFAAVEKFHPREVVLALEGRGGNWRRKIYPDYKKSRAKGKKESPVDFNKFFEVLDEFNNTMKTHLPFKILRLPGTEADDIIGVLARKICNEEKIIISSDKDFRQLLGCPKTKIWDPIKKIWIDSVNPYNELLLKVITGDASDEVPSLKRGVGTKRAEKLIGGGFEELKRWVKHEGLASEWKRNNQLVNLFKIPKLIEDEVLKRYGNYKLPTLQVPEFLYNYNFRYFIDRMDKVEGILLGLFN